MGYPLLECLTEALHNKDLDEAREITERHAREMELLQITAEAFWGTLSPPPILHEIHHNHHKH